MITRNVVSYDYKLKGKTSRDSERKSDVSTSDYGKSTNVVISKSINVKKDVTIKQTTNVQSE